MPASEMEKTIRLLKDTQDIKDLHREYVYWVADCEWDMVIDCFTEDCSVNLSKWGLRKGKGSLQKLFKEDIAHNNMGKGRDSHVATMPVINVDGDQAHGHWLMYVFISDPDTGKALRWFAGRHDTEYRRINGQWKIHRIVYTAPWPRTADSVPKLEE
jgi:ketosteroid isomerase-like protein